MGILFSHRALAKSLCPENIYIGVDVAKIGGSLYQNIGRAWEFNGSISFFPILTELDYGWALLERNHTHNLSHTTGHYFKTGLSYNFVEPTAYPNQLALGIRYARSFFNFQLKSGQIMCNHAGDSPCDQQCIPVPSCLQNLTGQGVVHWWELVVSAKVSLSALLSIGSALRFKFLKVLESSWHVLPFDLPGWGFMDDQYAFGYNLYICLNIPLKGVKNK